MISYCWKINYHQDMDVDAEQAGIFGKSDHEPMSRFLHERLICASLTLDIFLGLAYVHFIISSYYMYL